MRTITATLAEFLLIWEFRFAERTSKVNAVRGLSDNEIGDSTAWFGHRVTIARVKNINCIEIGIWYFASIDWYVNSMTKWVSFSAKPDSQTRRYSFGSSEANNQHLNSQKGQNQWVQNSSLYKYNK